VAFEKHWRGQLTHRRDVSLALCCQDLIVVSPDLSNKLPQASKDYPQLAEHAARMKCQPTTEFGRFLQV